MPIEHQRTAWRPDRILLQLNQTTHAEKLSLHATSMVQVFTGMVFFLSYSSFSKMEILMSAFSEHYSLAFNNELDLNFSNQWDLKFLRYLFRFQKKISKCTHSYALTYKPMEVLTSNYSSWSTRTCIENFSKRKRREASQGICLWAQMRKHLNTRGTHEKTKKENSFHFL